jgi:hypothetical protein
MTNDKNLLIAASCGEFTEKGLDKGDENIYSRSYRQHEVSGYDESQHARANQL